MNLWNLLMLKLRAAFTVHEANASVHHVKYLDSEAVTAVENETEIDLGIFSSATQHRCHIFNDAHYACPDAAVTQYPMDTIDYNIGSMADLTNDRITIQKAGVYLIGAMFDFSDPPAACNRALFVRVNGASVSVIGKYDSDYRAEIETTFTITLNAGDHVTLHAYQNSGGNLTIYGNSDPYTYSKGLSAIRIY